MRSLYTLRDDLEDAGYEVTLVRDGQKAREVMKKQHFDTAILDINMPGGNGLELLKIWSQEGEPTKVILITAFGTIETVVRTRNRRTVSE